MSSTIVRFFIALACTTLLGPVVARAATLADKPWNLLVIQTDEQRADTMAAYGNRRIHAPNMDRLAASSIVFERAYVTQPVCTPSRSAMLTGLWPHASGLTTNNIPLANTARCLPEMLGPTQYHTAHMGKWHLGDEVFPQHGFQEWVSIEDIYASYFGKDRAPGTPSSYHHFLTSLGYQPDDKGAFSRGFAARLPLEHCKPKFLEERACEFLRRKGNQPFVLYVSFLEPHMPFFGPLDREHSPAEVTLPSNFEDPLDDDEPADARRLRAKLLREGYGGHGEQRLKTESDWRQLIARYWGLVTQVDRSVGAILDTLDRQGLAEHTIVVFTSDHGDMMGSHRLLMKSLMYEEAVRVPWLIRVPGHPACRVPQPVSQIDLVPTVLELMGKAIPGHLQGKSLVPLLEKTAIADDYVFIEWPDPLCRTVISPDGWKLCLRVDDKCQLYHLSEDPGECTNLYYTGKHQEVIARLAGRLRAWQEKTHDSANVLKAGADAGEMVSSGTFRLELGKATIGELAKGWVAEKTGEGPGSVWKVVEDTSAPGGGRALAQTSPDGPNRLFNLCVARKTSFQDVDLTVAMKALAGKLDQGGGLVWRLRDANNYYVARVNPLEDNYCLYKVVQGKRIQLASAEIKAPAGSWHRLRIVHKGNHIQCYLNGKLELDARDAAFQDTGKVGLWTKADAQTSFAGLEVKLP